jgi:hypothetical protein
MNAEEFEKLDEKQKKILLFEALKIAEKKEDKNKTELFQIDDFFVESKTTIPFTTKRILTTLLLKPLN